MSEDNGTSRSAIWAITMIIIVAMIVGGIFYSGILSKKNVPDTNVDININPPAVNK